MRKFYVALSLALITVLTMSGIHPPRHGAHIG